MIRTVRSGRLRAQYSIGRTGRITGPSLPLEKYQQEDCYNCGFVAALAVVHYYHPNVPTPEVLRAVRPHPDYGVSAAQLVYGLARLGVRAVLHNDLTVATLRQQVERGVPVIISVWPTDYATDHWTVVRGFGLRRVYLTNHSPLTITKLVAQWSDMDMRSGRGLSMEGLLCYKESYNAKR